jgi:hypothetical protein
MAYLNGRNVLHGGKGKCSRVISGSELFAFVTAATRKTENKRMNAVFE